MGTPWHIHLFDGGVSPSLEKDIKEYLTGFDERFSRFKPHSRVTQLSQATGVYDVGKELVEMLRMYEKIHKLTHGLINPLVGHMLEDLGYDADYSLRLKNTIRAVPQFEEAVRILDDERIEMLQSALIDIGALGKGYAVREIGRMLGARHYLIDGSGDLLHHGDEDIKVGLEHPKDPKQAIGTLSLKNNALASSGTLRRSWGEHHHIVNPDARASADSVISSWVYTKDAAEADLLSTAIFLVDPATLTQHYEFEYLIVLSDMSVAKSDSFPGELF